MMSVAIVIRNATVPIGPTWGMRVAATAPPSTPATATAGDTDPSPALGNLPGSVRHSARITGPAVRRGWADAFDASPDELGRAAVETVRGFGYRFRPTS